MQTSFDQPFIENLKTPNNIKLKMILIYYKNFISI